MFDLNVDGNSYYLFDAANLMNGEDASEAFVSLINSVNTDILLKISGELSESTNYNTAVYAIFIASKNVEHNINLDLSEMTTTVSRKYLGGSGNSNTATGWNNLVSIVFPEDLTEINYSFFLGCIKLKTVIFGSKIEKLGYGGSFSGCSELETVVIPDDAPLVLIHEDTFAGCENLKYLKLPSSVILLGVRALPTTLEELIFEGDSATWYYITSRTEFDNGMNDIIAGRENFKTEYTLDSLCTAVPDYTLAQKLLYALVQNPTYYFYCIK